MWAITLIMLKTFIYLDLPDFYLIHNSELKPAFQDSSLNPE
uniref:Uncharacterized protein n=1 Tax=Cyanothece sp. (strain PCC 7425 / ATCC 29141) TaxID=395961 RepID=B8HYK8_CYAP4